jgi:large subunit ribosomal protein L22
VSNAKTNFQLEEGNLYISKILVDEGPKYKRWMPRARGVASPIQKKTSHVTIVLEEIIKKPKDLKKVIEEIKEIEKKIKKIEKVSKKEKPKLRPEREAPKFKIGKGLRRIFRRKAF